MTQATTTPAATPAAAPKPERRLRKWLGVGVVFLFAAGSIYWGIRTAFPPAPPIPEDFDGIMRVLQSKSFAGMSDRQRKPYYDKMQSLTKSIPPKELGEKFRNLPKEVRDDATFKANSRDAMADQMLNMISLWASTPAPLRNMVLDKMIDQQESHKPRAPGTNADGSQRTPEQEAERKAKRERERDEGMKWMQQQVERGNPQKQAYVGEFIKAMRARRIARGLSPDGPQR